jgi:1-aminocyclopropane-1-carboxylate deaminase
MDDLPYMTGTWSAFTPGHVQEIQATPCAPRLSMLRLDLIKSWAAGNKYYKLKYALKYVLAQGIHTIISKGGMFSNHLAALSEACYAFNIRLIAVIRSNGPDEMNPSIRRLRANGNEIVYLSPEKYKSFHQEDSEQLCSGAWFIPEGGLSAPGIEGAAEIMKDCHQDMLSHIVVAGGSMGTACGIISSAASATKVIIVPAWKGCTDGYIADILQQYSIVPTCSWELWADYHFGGFGKFSQQLIEFMSAFSSATSIPLDPVYNGKMMFAIADKLNSGYFKETDNIMAVHTGGLQGLEGYKYRFPEAWGAYLP